MGINTATIKTKVSAGRLLSGTLMIAGTTVGAGMLGIPLVTAPAGFWPAASVTAMVWLFMMATGFLFLEVSLWMPNETNILSMTYRFMGKKGKFAVGLMFAFLYYCLMVAYFAAGAPLVANFFHTFFGIELQGWYGYAVFGLIFGFIVALGAKSIDRTNIVITVAMAASFVGLLGVGGECVDTARGSFYNWPGAIVAIPVMFSAFGYHNVIPSLCTYLKRDRRVLTFSILFGTLIPLTMYLFWQWLIIGSIPQETILEAKALGKPATTALQAISGSRWIYTIGQSFAFFAIVTSMLGVAFSMVDFLGDGLKISRNGLKRIFLTILTFLPPFLFAVLDPSVFDRALGVAGGIGEAFLNGILPVALVWIGKYTANLPVNSKWLSTRSSLAALLIVSLVVMSLEILSLLK